MAAARAGDKGAPELQVNQGLPESINEGYGWGKRVLEIQSRYIHEKHGLPIAIVRPFNAYGGRYRWQGGRLTSSRRS